MENLRLNALALHLKVDADELTVNSYNDLLIEYGNEEYLVVTDEEADELWDEDLDNYINECILPQLPDNLRNYFDDEAWKHDARFDGRAHSLARYDGNEEYLTVYEFMNDNEEYLYAKDEFSFIEDETVLQVDSQEFYIYRTN